MHTCAHTHVYMRTHIFNSGCESFVFSLFTNWQSEEGEASLWPLPWSLLVKSSESSKNFKTAKSGKKIINRTTGFFFFFKVISVRWLLLCSHLHPCWWSLDWKSTESSDFSYSALWSWETALWTSRSSWWLLCTHDLMLSQVPRYCSAALALNQLGDGYWWHPQRVLLWPCCLGWIPQFWWLSILQGRKKVLQ